MFRLAILKFYFKLMNVLLPSYFVTMKPTLPMICNYHEIWRPTFHLPYIVHTFAEQLVQYKMIKILNDKSTSLQITGKVHTHSFQRFKLSIINNVIDSYTDQCYALRCFNQCARLIRE